MCREWFWAAAVEVDSRYILHDGLCSLDSELWIGGANLVYEIWFFDWVGGEHRSGFAIVGYHTSYGWSKEVVRTNILGDAKSY